jgi:hypothetical protein
MRFASCFILLMLLAAPSMAQTKAGASVAPGKYNCFAYTNPTIPILAETIFLSPDGGYRTLAGKNNGGH